MYLVSYAHLSGLPPEAGAARAFGWVNPKGAKASVYVLAGKTPADIVDAVMRFAELKSAPAQGLLFSVP